MSEERKYTDADVENLGKLCVGYTMELVDLREFIYGNDMDTTAVRDDDLRGGRAYEEGTVENVLKEHVDALIRIRKSLPFATIAERAETSICEQWGEIDPYIPFSLRRAGIDITHLRDWLFGYRKDWADVLK